MWQKGQTPVAGYKLEKFLGKGNFGEVWQSTSPGGTKCALKFLNLQERQGRKEFKAIQHLKQIRHANLLPINAMWLLDESMQVISDDNLDTAQSLMEDTHRRTLVAVSPPQEGEKPKTLVIAMPLAEGNLMELLQRTQQDGREIPTDELLMYMTDTARALDYLNSAQHDLGAGPIAVQHGDVKPENLLLLGGSVVLCDFGVARTLGGGMDTRSTTLGGSLAYMAPEGLAGQTSRHSDQFSLAISYAELRTGELPFPDESLTRVIEDRKKGELVLDGLTPGEQRVIRKATAVNPDKRFDSNVEMVDALRAALLGEPARASRTWIALGSIPLLLLVAAVATWAMGFWEPNKNNGPDNPPIEKTGQEYYAKALKLIHSSSALDAEAMARATELYAAALQTGMKPEVPKPARLGVQLNESHPVYSRGQLLAMTSLFAIHPASGRVLVIGGDGKSLVEPGLADAAGRESIPLDLASPIASVDWLDESQLLVRDCELRNLWRVEVETGQMTKVAEGVLRVAASATAGVAIAASEDQLLLVSPTDANRVVSLPDRQRMLSPLIGIDEPGQWAVLAEEFDVGESATLLPLQAEQQSLRIGIKPQCASCLRIGNQSFALVGGDTRDAGVGLAVVKLGENMNPESILRPQLPAENRDLFGTRNVLSLATFAFPGESSSAMLAAGQQLLGDAGAADVWEMQTDGTIKHLGSVGQIESWGVTAVAFDPTGQWLVRGSGYGEVILTHRESNRDFQLLTEEYQAKVSQLGFVGGRLFCGFDDASVMMWNLRECEMVFEACRKQNKQLPQPAAEKTQEG